MQESEYRVAWEIDIPAESPKDAIKQAMAYLKPKEPARWCYSVQNHATGKVSKHEGEDVF